MLHYTTSSKFTAERKPTSKTISQVSLFFSLHIMCLLISFTGVGVGVTFQIKNVQLMFNCSLWKLQWKVNERPLVVAQYPPPPLETGSCPSNKQKSPRCRKFQRSHGFF